MLGKRTEMDVGRKYAFFVVLLAAACAGRYDPEDTNPYAFGK